MNSNPRFGFIFTSCPMDGLADISDFEDATWHASGYDYGETAQDAIIGACKSCYQDCTLWEVPRYPRGYLVEFNNDGDVVGVEQKELCILGELTYSVEFDNGDKTTFFKSTN